MLDIIQYTIRFVIPKDVADEIGISFNVCSQTRKAQTQVISIFAPDNVIFQLIVNVFQLDTSIFAPDIFKKSFFIDRIIKNESKKSMNLIEF